MKRFVPLRRRILPVHGILPLLAAIGFATAAVAADPPGNPAGSPATGSLATAPAVPATTFIAKVAAGNQFEIDSSELALARTRSEPVKAFARRMVDDHTAAGTRFKQAISDSKLTAPPEKLDAAHQAVFDSLKGKDAASFDKAYIDAQYKAHVETVDLFTAYARDGDNARLKKFAAELLPTLQSHLEHVSKMR